jgi:hypothetical protein
MLDVPASWIRKKDTGTFTGDAWADDPTLDVPDDDVPRFVADGSPVRWKVYGMDGRLPGSAQEVDTTASLSTCLVKIDTMTRGPTFVSALVASSGTILAHEVTEPDVSAGDIFVIAVPAFVAGTAPWIWIVPTAGCRLLASGVSL